MTDNYTDDEQAIQQATKVQSETIKDSTQQQNKGFFRSLFDDLSVAQVIAGALAAATVFLMSSTIGIAGSLIGTAVGSVVSAVSSQVYKKMLSASAGKIRDAAPTSHLDATTSLTSKEYHHAQGSNPSQTAQTKETTWVPSSETVALDHSISQQETQVVTEASIQEGETSDPARTTQVLSSGVSDSATRVMNANDARYASQGDNGEDPALRRAHEKRSKKAKIQRNVIIVSIVSALITIVIAAVVIFVATSGEGIGTKTEPIFSTASDTAYDTDSVEQGTTTNTGDQSDQTDEEQNASDTSSSSSSQSGRESSSESDLQSGQSSSSGSSSQNSSSGSSSGSSSSGSGSSDSESSNDSGLSGESGSDSEGSNSQSALSSTSE